MDSRRWKQPILKISRLNYEGWLRIFRTSGTTKCWLLPNCTTCYDLTSRNRLSENRRPEGTWIIEEPEVACSLYDWIPTEGSKVSTNSVDGLNPDMAFDRQQKGRWRSKGLIPPSETTKWAGKSSHFIAKTVSTHSPQCTSEKVAMEIWAPIHRNIGRYSTCRQRASIERRSRRWEVGFLKTPWAYLL